MVHITNTTQFSIFSYLRTIITSNATLGNRFNNTNILQFDVISLKHQSLPYIYLQIPESVSIPETIKGELSTKTFTVPAYMFVSYTAKDKVLDFINAFVIAMESDVTLKAIGYYDIGCELQRVSTEERDGNVIIVTEFSIELRGNVQV